MSALYPLLPYIMVLVFVIMFSMLTCSLLLQVRQLTSKHSPRINKETRVRQDGMRV